MHWNLEQIVWALMLAGHLVLLVVLMGRDRVRVFPWFTVLTVGSTLELLAEHLLNDKLTTLATYWVNFSAMVVIWVLGVFVLAELARRIFSSGRAGLILNARGWLGWTMVTVGLALLAIWFWGPWPTWQALQTEYKTEPVQFRIMVLVLTATRGQMALAILTVEVVLLFTLFAKRFGFNWRTHPRQIASGLVANALGILSISGLAEYLKHYRNLSSPEVLRQSQALVENAEKGRHVLGVLVLIWWIVCLWRDDPSTSPADLAGAPVPAVAGPPTLEGQVAVDPDDDEMSFRD